ncbi:MAG: NAD-dependent succinate-semialdehyde dehydrogenase [Parvularculaceae bacterium]|nr:NAD-dependent succinate-semialdehyde dehydrogenase [Parvularculaceae bacterium]
MSIYPDLNLYIDGVWRNTSDRLAVLNPANEEIIGRLPVATKADLDDALAAAEKGLRIWRNTSPAHRCQVMLKAAALMRAHQEDIAQAITLEQGKPLHESRLEVIRGCEFIEWDAGECQRLYGRVIPSKPGIRYLVIHEPVGVVAGFSPWNFPMSQPCRKIAGALAAGCSIILKAAEETPAGAIHIARAFHEAGLPPGVLNLVFGSPAEISDYLIPRKSVRLVAFTGSTAVGKALTRLAAGDMTPVLMELGGHAPVIVCDDVDPAAVAVTCATRKYRNAGQVCTSPTRFFVPERHFRAFTDAFAEHARSIRIGDGRDPQTQMGPTANSRRPEALHALVDDACARGAILKAGGGRHNGKGYFFEPAVIVDAPDNARIMNEEPFGPLAVINPVSTLDEAIEKANSLPYGLASYAFTNSARTAEELTRRIETGNFSINTLEASVAETPFGGVKESGYSREGGAEGVLNYTTVKTVSHVTA